MCGIAGIIEFNPSGRAQGVRLKRMRDAIRHRGPDDNGMIMTGRAALAHCRLSIIDLVSGQQPMANADRSIWITFNGEIYNYRLLRTELARRGCRFVTKSDTEVILRAYEVFGDECVKYLRGMFAFAIWDERQQKLFLARDRIGIKPLYYAITDDEILFGSEIKAILAADGIEPVFNRKILPEYLATRFVAGDQTFFKGIHKLLPGHIFTWTPAQGIRLSRYWQLPEAIRETDLSHEQLAREVRARLEEAVRSHLVSDVPLGLFLSGGIDSSALAAIMAPMMDGPLLTFSVAFAEPGYNEFRFARLAAQAVGAEHRELLLAPEAFFATLPRMIWHEDEPIAFPSSVSLNMVSRLAANHVKVVLTGEGADELFLGYNRYRVTAWNTRLGNLYQAAVPGRLANSMPRLIERLPGSLRRYLSRSFLGQPAGIRSLFYENFAVFPRALQRRLFAATRRAGDPYAESLHFYQQAPGGLLERMCYADLQTYLVELLMKQDQMSMAASIESRVPFLDHEFVEFAAAIPGRYKLRGLQTKAVLRRAVKDLVPREILTRGKMGFPVPLRGWFRGTFSSLLDQWVLTPRALDRGLFDAEYVRQLVAEHRQGIRDHSDRLWMLVNLELWQRIFIEGERPERAAGNASTGEPLRAVA